MEQTNVLSVISSCQEGGPYIEVVRMECQGMDCAPGGRGKGTGGRTNHESFLYICFEARRRKL